MGVSQFPPSDTIVNGTPVLVDPVNRFRVSQPQALIDTDFEYGTQISKWENLGLTNNRPFVYNTQVPITTVTGVSQPTGSRTVTVTCSSGAPAVNTAVSVQDTFLAIANGNYLVETSNGSTSFTYTAKAVNTSTVTNIFDANKTIFSTGAIYTGAQIGGAPNSVTYSGTTILVVTTVPHGLSLGNEIAIMGLTASTNAPNGSFAVTGIVDAVTFRYNVITAPTGTIGFSVGKVYTRPQAQFLHRPFDGGVIFSSNGTSNFESSIRQTRRYFRYQSGKGVQMSSGTLLKPDLQLDSLTSVGTTVTVQTKEKHNLQPGSTIYVYDANETAYNGTFTVYTVTGYNTLTYIALSVPSASTASGQYYISVSTWYGCVNRIGVFDQQNGMFFEFDGTTLWAVKRSSTFQISGKVSATNGSCDINQTDPSFPTRFAKQLKTGDYIVLRGQSYRIMDISSDTNMTINPAYRGATADMVIVSKTIDTKIAQANWNIDKFDGTGPSGYNLDLSKMQMFYIDYSWYGAGSIRWGLRAADGNVTYCHKMLNNNTNSESFMRSGNLPARYESTTQPPDTEITQTFSSSATTLYVGSTNGFPSAGTLVISNNLYGWEFINYTGKTETTFTGITRAQSGNPSLALTVSTGSNVCTVASIANLQVGQRLSGLNIPEGTFISKIANATTIELSQAVTGASPTVAAIPMAGAPITFNYSSTNPVNVELAYPTYAPSISHWGTSIIMDGRFDDDKSLVFTYGQATGVSVAPGATNAILAIRVAPSVDNGTSGVFGSRELINRMQLILRALDLTTTTTNANLLVTATLNGTPSQTQTWIKPSVSTSSLAQVANFTSGATVTGGEVTGGFFVSTGANSIDLNPVRDLGNCVLGGGGTTTASGIYPDGPDVLIISVTNLGSLSATVFSRISWTEAQA